MTEWIKVDFLELNMPKQKQFKLAKAQNWPATKPKLREPLRKN